MTRPELLELYRKTTFVYRAPLPCPRFVVLTADAPTGERWSPSRTRRARRELERLLSGLPHRSVTGCDPRGSHSEKGWAFPCPDDEALAAARALGCGLRQFALFHVQDGRLELVWCAEPDARHDLGAWAARRIPRP